MPPKTIHNAPPVSRCFKMFQDSCHIQAHPGGWVLKQHLGQLCSIESSPGKAITSAPCTSNYCSNMDSWIVRMWFWGPRRSNAQYLALLILSDYPLSGTVWHGIGETWAVPVLSHQADCLTQLFHEVHVECNTFDSGGIPESAGLPMYENFKSIYGIYTFFFARSHLCQSPIAMSHPSAQSTCGYQSA